jgi:hypothetical protein
MMPFLFGSGADGVGKGDGIFEVFEFVEAIEFGNVVFTDDLPLRNFGMQRLDFVLGHRRRADPASDAFLFSQLFHVKLLFNLNFSRQGAKTPSSELVSFRPMGESLSDPSVSLSMAGIGPSPLRLGAFAGGIPRFAFGLVALVLRPE